VKRKFKIAVTTAPFAAHNTAPLVNLRGLDAEVIQNPFGRRMTESEVAEFIKDCDAVIAGTERISAEAIAGCERLKIVSRVGIGLDGVDLVAARDNGVAVAYTPDAPAPAVAELTIGLILSVFRSVHIANSRMHDGEWERFFGTRVGNSTIGVCGLGRVGTRVVELLRAFSGVEILVFDINETAYHRVEQCPEVQTVASVEELFERSDCVTLHLPLTPVSAGMVNSKLMQKMKKPGFLVNTSRGGIVIEDDLADMLDRGAISGAAMDVFSAEPYNGVLCGIANCLLTCHMGSMSFDCRSLMEIEATDAVVNFLTSGFTDKLVPSFEYDMQRASN